LQRPDTDFHTLVGEMTGLGRDTAKTANFAKGYGSGVATFAKTIDKSHEEAADIMAQYDAKLPFVAKLFHIEQEKAARTGITRLYDGALRHWNLYALPWRDHEACSFEEARRRVTDPEHPWCGQQLGRAGTRKAFNALVQGLGARHTKLWMRLCFREGIIPLLQMHDALECSVTSREQGEMIARLGEEAVSLNVPMKVDLKFGKTWGDASHSWEELTGESAPAKPAPKPAPRPALVIPLKPAIIIPPKPTISIPLPPPVIAIPPKPAIVNPLPPPAPAEKKKKPPLPPTPPLDDTEIDLADLVDCPVPRNRMVLCPLHGETKPSMRIYTDHYYCFGCGAWGDHVDWLVRVEGLEYDHARDIVDNWDGPVVARSQAQDAEDDARRTASALKWWDAAEPLAGTLAARYLADVRGIDLDALPAGIDDSLRFHPHCIFGPGTVHPCLLALMRDPVSDAPTGIQRIAPTSDAQKIDRMMLGPSGVVQLWPAGKQLVIGEGLETTLAAATRLTYRDAPLQPAWAMLSEGGMRRFPVIDGVERLILLADHDHNGAGQAAAEECKRRWQQAGRSGVLLTPDRPGADFNDIVIDTMWERVQ
jgi:DNA polymerase family A/Toprim domain/CHC2 zinc finger